MLSTLKFLLALTYVHAVCVDTVVDRFIMRADGSSFQNNALGGRVATVDLVTHRHLMNEEYLSTNPMHKAILPKDQKNSYSTNLFSGPGGCFDATEFEEIALVYQPLISKVVNTEGRTLFSAEVDIMDATCTFVESTLSLGDVVGKPQLITDSSTVHSFSLRNLSPHYKKKFGKISFINFGPVFGTFMLHELNFLCASGSAPSLAHESIPFPIVAKEVAIQP